MENQMITSKETILYKLEEMSLKLDSLAALATVCGSAFITDDSFGNMNPKDVHESFNNISNQIKEVSKDAGVLITAIYGNRSGSEAADG